jgi:high-affinity iron transporter
LPRAPLEFLARLTLCAALGLLAARPVGAAAAPPSGAAGSDAAQRTIHLLEYVAVDYPGAVRDGQVASEVEYAEQIEFAAQVRRQLAELGVEAEDPLAGEAAALEAGVRARAPGSEVAVRAHGLADGVRERFAVRALPPRVPDLARGRTLYAEACASCHGPEGRGDGPAAAGLDPAPADLTNRSRLLALSPFAIASTIAYGIDGTAMVPFAGRFDAADRYDLAFFAGSLAFTGAEVARGAALAQAAPLQAAARVPGLEDLVYRSADELGADSDGRALVAYLRTHPEALRAGELPVGIARTRLADSWAAYERGDGRRALDLAISAYLDGFEHAEPALDAVDPGLRRAIEADFLRYREALGASQPVAAVEPLHAALAAELADAEQRLGGEVLGPAAVFVSSLTILAREGLEALLLVVALCSVLIRSGRRDALPWVHGGWIAALAAGAATWWAATWLIEISGASREVVEGVSALFASAILFYVSYWLLSRIEVARWQAFLDRKVRGALSAGSLWLLAAVSFIAIYREMLETALFYEALGAQAGPGGRHALALGIGAGAGLLALLAVLVFRFGQRLPMRRFFALSSILLYLLAVVMAGQGIAALQEAGWLPATGAPFVRIEWLGIYPTVQGLAVQLALAIAALFALPRRVRRAERPPADAEQPAG